MTGDVPLLSGIFFQGAGLVLFTLGRSAFSRAFAVPLLFAGAAAIAVFAVMERHFLLLVAQAAGVLLIRMGVAGGRRGGGE